ncbi:CHAT domain-containing protein [Streptomyces sp. MZ04]|uniref:CHAT domain-containing protein n=1 Tax=Streptomyces sp. MZ04 TaxID=2559236 RepID=UPI001FD7AB9D|nr:CHAT domain-containing protein [Streptomyces sp. MZ04]
MPVPVSEENTLTQLEAERTELLDHLAGLASDDPDAPELCAYAGELSYRIHVLSDGASGTEDLDLAAEAFGHAFAAPGTDDDWHAWRIVYAHVRAFQYELDPTDQLIDECWELLLAGTAPLPADEEAYDNVRALGRHLLALCSKERYTRYAANATRDERGTLLDEAVRRIEDADGILEEGSQEAVDLREALGYLCFERCLLRGDAEDAATAAGHYRAVLEAELPTTDLPFVRHSMAVALLSHGRVAGDRDELEEAREAFGTAQRDALRRTGQRPPWHVEAEVRAVFIRVLMWSTWKDQAHGAAAEVELNSLLAEPGVTEGLLPQFLDGFGRLLYERASARGDAEGRDRGIGLLRSAVTAWQPERDGRVAGTALLLGVFQYARHQEDPDPRRVADAAAAAELALADPQLERELHKMALILRGWVRFVRGEQPGGSGPGGSGDDVADAYRAIMDDLGEGRSFLDFSGTDEDHPGFYNGFGTDRLAAGFDTVYAQWSAMEPGAERAGVAAGLLTHLRFLDPHGEHVSTEQKDALTEEVLQHGEDDPRWQHLAHMAAGTSRLADEMAGAGSDMDTVLDHFAQARAADARAGGTSGHGADFATMMATVQRGQFGGGADDGDVARDAWQKLRGRPSLTPHVRRLMDAQQASFDAGAALRSGDLATADRHIAQVRETHAALDPEDPSRAELWTLVEIDLMLRDDLARQLGAPASPPPPERPTVAALRRMAVRLPRDHRAWILGDNGTSRFTRAMRARDPIALVESMELIQEAHDMVDEGSDSRLRYANVLGGGHCALAEIQRDPRERDRRLAKGIALLESSFEAAAGPEHRLYASTGLGLARAYRTRAALRHDDRANARRIGLDALRGHAWAALLQSGTDHATQAAAQATGAALEVAGWCLRDDVPEQAVRALDACRGLVLHAATTSSTVRDRLVAVGREDLAAQWQEAGGTSATPEAGPLSTAQAPPLIPSALRRHVLAALTGEEAPPGEGTPQDRLLDPPTPAEIATALRTLGKDALVYLVPASDDGGGAAVVVTNGGDTHSVPLPQLREDAAPLRTYAPASGGARDMGPVPGYAAPEPPAGQPALRDRLDRLCGWAWYAAMRPLFDAFALPPGRVPRLVLVPMGALGLVPWHAAWDQRDGGSRRYALQDAEISYAASARLLCDVAARTAVTHTGQALVVGNPTGDLRYAGEEADAVQRAFYPEGHFLGTRSGGRADGAGTPHEVLTWLRSGGEDSGAVLHLACHAAVARNERATAYLSLHGGELAAEELTEALSGGGRGRLGLVLLAACRSHVSGRGHNEAYTLSTAFLVAGARSVIGSLWPVPDDATSVLMFLTHHFLRTRGEPPAKALRRAQLWILDPERELPPDLPPLLRVRAGALDPDDLSGWAGFTHLGQ